MSRDQCCGGGDDDDRIPGSTGEVSEWVDDVHDKDDDKT